MSEILNENQITGNTQAAGAQQLWTFPQLFTCLIGFCILSLILIWTALSKPAMPAAHARDQLPRDGVARARGRSDAGDPVPSFRQFVC